MGKFGSVFDGTIIALGGTTIVLMRRVNQKLSNEEAYGDEESVLRMT